MVPPLVGETRGLESTERDMRRKECDDRRRMRCDNHGTTPHISGTISDELTDAEQAAQPTGLGLPPTCGLMLGSEKPYRRYPQDLGLPTPSPGHAPRDDISPESRP